MQVFLQEVFSFHTVVIRDCFALSHLLHLWLAKKKSLERKRCSNSFVPVLPGCRTAPVGQPSSAAPHPCGTDAGKVVRTQRQEGDEGFEGERNTYASASFDFRDVMRQYPGRDFGTVDPVSRKEQRDIMDPSGRFGNPEVRPYRSGKTKSGQYGRACSRLLDISQNEVG